MPILLPFEVRITHRTRTPNPLEINIKNNALNKICLNFSLHQVFQVITSTLCQVCQVQRCNGRVKRIYGLSTRGELILMEIPIPALCISLEVLDDVNTIRTVMAK